MHSIHSFFISAFIFLSSRQTKQSPPGHRQRFFCPPSPRTAASFLPSRFQKQVTFQHHKRPQRRSRRSPPALKTPAVPPLGSRRPFLAAYRLAFHAAPTPEEKLVVARPRAHAPFPPSYLYTSPPASSSAAPPAAGSAARGGQDATSSALASHASHAPFHSAVEHFTPAGPGSWSAMARQH